MLPIKIVLRSKFPWTNFKNYEYFGMKFEAEPGRARAYDRWHRRHPGPGPLSQGGTSPVQTPLIHKLGFNQDYYTLTFILQMIIALGCKFPTNCMCFEMKSEAELGRAGGWDRWLRRHPGPGMQTLMIYKPSFNQNYCTFTLMLQIKTVLCSKFPRTEFIPYQCFEMKSATEPGRAWRRDRSHRRHPGPGPSSHGVALGNQGTRNLFSIKITTRLL